VAKRKENVRLPIKISARKSKQKKSNVNIPVSAKNRVTYLIS